jgi:hypothetical protein
MTKCATVRVDLSKIAIMINNGTRSFASANVSITKNAPFTNIGMNGAVNAFATKSSNVKLDSIGTKLFANVFHAHSLVKIYPAKVYQYGTRMNAVATVQRSFKIPARIPNSVRSAAFASNAKVTPFSITRHALASAI